MSLVKYSHCFIHKFTDVTCNKECSEWFVWCFFVYNYHMLDPSKLLEQCGHPSCTSGIQYHIFLHPSWRQRALDSNFH